MMREAEKIGVKQRDDMRKLPVFEQRRLQIAAASYIAKMNSDILLVDTHLFIKTSEGYWPGLPNNVASALAPTHLIMITASPEDILGRRQSDTSRNRDKASEKEILEELEIGKNMLCSLAIFTGAAMIYVQNAEGKVNEASDQIVSAIGNEFS
jgi:adenylate kinase